MNYDPDEDYTDEGCSDDNRLTLREWGVLLLIFLTGVAFVAFTIFHS